MEKKALLLFLCVSFIIAASAQSIDPALQKAVDAMGTTKVNNLQYSGTGKVGSFGQSYWPGVDWPMFIVKSYTRTIDYNTMSSREEFVRVYDNPPAKGGGAPFINESKQNNIITGLPASPEGTEEKHLQLLITPHGFLKQALKGKVTVTKLKDNKTEISFPAGKYKIAGTITADGLVEKVNTWTHNHVLGDMLIETIYSDYKDYQGIKAPSRIVQQQGDHPVLILLADAVQTNISNLVIPSPVPAPSPQAVVVESKKLADWVWFLGGGSHNSLLFEFNDHVVVFEAPLHEARSLAVIAEVKKLVPGKPIKYVINSHHHFDHSGGLRTYVAEGIAIITNEANAKFYEQVWKAPRTLSPDILSKSPKKASFLTMKEKYTLTDGTRTLELHIDQESTHNATLYMGYLPQEKILITVDDYSPGRLVNGKLVPVAQGFAETLYANIQRLKFDVVTIAPGHGEVVPFSDFVRDLGK
jgi:glyoxylase-like metal-dependent hydrolase (beta-lactamase superfamily II)